MRRTFLPVSLGLALAASLSTALPAHAQQSPADAMVAAAERAYGEARARFDTGSEPLESVYTWSLRWMESERRRRASDGARAAQAHRARMQSTCAAVQQRVASGMLTRDAQTACTYYLAEADVLAR